MANVDVSITLPPFPPPLSALPRLGPRACISTRHAHTPTYQPVRAPHPYSSAHLNAGLDRDSYKALNTFIDDLFAFIIKMPTMHRLACFRDDVIFFIYLYQRYVYRVDKTRPNEYGLIPEGEA